jgi:ribonuclease R
LFNFFRKKKQEKPVPQHPSPAPQQENRHSRRNKKRRHHGSNQTQQQPSGQQHPSSDHGQKKHKKQGGQHQHQGGHGQAHKRRQSSHASSGRELTGIVQANEKGFGFFIPEDGSSDAFLPPHQMRDILNGDTIKARVSPDSYKKGKFIAEFVSIVKRAHTTLVGTLVQEAGRWFLKADDLRVTQPIFLKGGPGAGRPGEKVVVRILRWPGQGGPMEGQLDEVLGVPGDPGVDIKGVIRKYQWPDLFPHAVEDQVRGYPSDPGPSDWQGRLDLRMVPILTIDGADAKDFDDALSLERTANGGYRLGVHIADVSHYVKEGTPLDQEAKARATSLYLADRVLPMLPYSLSDGLCSLREGVPRLTLSAFLEYSSQGDFLRSEFAQTVIQSGRRGIYEEVQQVMDGKASPELKAKYSQFEGILAEMGKLSGFIRARRERAGSLDFDFPEVRAVMDPSGKVVDVRKKERLGSHKLIEDFMVAANEAVATHLTHLKMPALYRIHEPPSPQDLEELIDFLRAYQIPFKALDLSTPKGLQILMSQTHDGPYGAVVANLSLRSLKLAVYATRNAGHFGLGLDSYCHFTSPIRRYPDLMVHRALKKAILHEKPGPSQGHEKSALHCSLQERAAEKAERESQKILQLRFMEDKVGRTFEGAVRHLTQHGLFMELDPYGVEGFLPLESLRDDAYEFDQLSLILKGRKGGKIQLGDRLKARVASVDMPLQRLTLARIY